MTYTETHFKNCPFSPFDEKLFKRHPSLVALVPPDGEEGQEGVMATVSPENVLRYIIALYDPKSPLLKGEQNLNRRKDVAADIAGIDKEKYIKEVMFMYECRDDRFVLYVQNYLRYYAKSMEWAMIQSFEQAFWEYQSRLMQPIERGDKDKDLISAVQLKTKLSDDIQSLYDKYQAALEKFYGEDKELIVASAQITRFTPESVAKLKRI